MLKYCFLLVLWMGNFLQAQVPPPQDFALVETNLSASHILIAWKDVNENVSRNKRAAKALAEEIIQKLNADNTQFGKLALEFTDDTGSKPKSGYLGSFPKGKMVKSFEDAVLSLQENEFTRVPIPSEFGFHIIKREKIAEPLFGAYLHFKANTLPTIINRSGLDSLFATSNLSIIKAREPEIPALIPVLSGLAYDEIGELTLPTGTLYVKRVELIPVKGSHILIGWKSENMPVRRSKSEAQAYAQELLQQVLANPALFEQFAEEVSDSPAKRRKGSIGLWFKGGKIARYALSTTAIQTLAKGEIGTTIIEGNSWFEIIRRD